MKSSVIVFPGSNCDRDVAVALEKFQIKNQMVWHDESNLPKSDFNNKFCLNYKKKNIIKLPIAHNEGNFFANNELLQKLEDRNLVAFKYCNEKGDINKTSNPNGSSNNIAGILNDKKNILGMMPHPERLIDPLLSGEDGSIMFESLLKSH